MSEPREPSARELLQRISKQLDILTMILLDIRSDGLEAMGSLPRQMVVEQDGELPNPLTERRQRAQQPAEQTVENDGLLYTRRPLPGNHWLMLTSDPVSGQISNMRIQLPNGDIVPISEEELQASFGDASLFTRPDNGQPPRDALNPDLVTPDER